MLRLTVEQYVALQARSGKVPAVQIEQGTNRSGKSKAEKLNLNVLKKSAHSDEFDFEQVPVEKIYGVLDVTNPNGRVELIWKKGFKMLSLNVMLRRDMRSLVGYKAKCFELAKEIADEMRSRNMTLPFESEETTRVDLIIARSATKLVDIDAISAMFKFLIDGFRACGVLPDDNPSFVRSIQVVQRKGPWAVGIGFCLLKESPAIDEAGKQ